MEWLLLLIPWILAAAWAFWIKNMIIFGILFILAVVHLLQIKNWPLPVSIQLATLAGQLAWLTAAALYNIPLLLVGFVLQWITLPIFTSVLKKERRKAAIIESNYEQQTDLLYELRKQRHDLFKHISALEHGHELSQRADQYKADLHSRYDEVNQVIRSESNIVAGALYAYFEQARKNDVELTYHIQQPISGIPLADFDLIALIGNILENANDAAFQFKEETGKKGKISFFCRKQSGIWIINCTNDTLPLHDQIIERIFTSRSLSTKGGHHEGIGTQEIKRIVKANGGTLDFSAFKNQFLLKIKIPDIKTTF